MDICVFQLRQARRKLRPTFPDLMGKQSPGSLGKNEEIRFPVTSGVLAVIPRVWTLNTVQITACKNAIRVRAAHAIGGLNSTLSLFLFR